MCEQDRIIRCGIIGVLIFICVIIAQINYLLFHTIIEYFSGTISFLIFCLAVGTSGKTDNGFLQVLGTVFGIITIINLLHILTYNGMSVFNTTKDMMNYSNQFWIIEQLFLAVSLCISPFFINKNVSFKTIFFPALVIAGVMVILVWKDYLPDCSILGQGLSNFKIYSEYMICILIMVSLIHLKHQKEKLDNTVYVFCILALCCILLSEICFTMYKSYFSFPNFIGHILRLIYFGLFFEGIGIETIRFPYKKLYQAYDSIVWTWSKAVEMRDEETGGHSERVVEMTVRVARFMGMNKKEIGDIRHGALLHDLGKIVIPDQILLNSGSLSDDEMKEMKNHPLYARELFSAIPDADRILEIPVYHHEKYDGSGYPYGLKGEEIPISARIFAVVDVWDALSNDRRYRKAWPKAKVMEYIRNERGGHFDPIVVDIFLKLISSKEIVEKPT